MIQDQKMLDYIKAVTQNLPDDWLRLTTHRLDIYNEKLAKAEFLEQFERLYHANHSEASALNELPTAYDYIRLGHPLSCVLEWVIAKSHQVAPKNVISFSSKTIALLAILRKNLLDKKHTQIFYSDSMPEGFDAELLREVYGYQFDLKKVYGIREVNSSESSVFITASDNVCQFDSHLDIDFMINTHPSLGSIVMINERLDDSYIKDIQHVRRRETIAMTPSNCLHALQILVDQEVSETCGHHHAENKAQVLKSIQEITGSNTKALVASSGLSIQYAILMGLVHDAMKNHQNKEIKIVVPPNCYGGTNDQARRVAACLDQVEIVDLPVDGDHDMVQSIELVLSQIAEQDAIPLIIAEIPTNPRVEVPDLIQLQNALTSVRMNPKNEKAVDPVFILDQTFCPNVQLLGEGKMLSKVRTISFSSGSKFPSGGLCNAGYCIGNTKTIALIDNIEKHLHLCDNEATPLQYEILAQQFPSMNQRIEEAYENTRSFVQFIQKTLPEAKINFVSEDLAAQGFTPSVFSMDLPTQGDTPEEREAYKRALNLKLIHLMITEIPNESKYCVSYGQLKGCYWTIPATSTQGTTKEGDKDYIVRASLSPKMDLEKHQEVFLRFCESM